MSLPCAPIQTLTRCLVCAGDRIRGVLWALQSAAATQRILLLNHSDPLPLEEVGEGPGAWVVRGLFMGMVLQGKTVCSASD